MFYPLPLVLVTIGGLPKKKSRRDLLEILNFPRKRQKAPAATKMALEYHEEKSHQVPFIYYTLVLA